MFPTVSIFGYNIQSMWLACVAGACVCCALVLFRSKKLALPSVDVTNAGAMGLVGVLIGGKILYLCTILPILMQYWGQLVQRPQLLVQITLTSGTVYYGGLLGFLAAVQWYLRRYRLNAALFWDCIAPAIPLFHVFGRIGCFLNGCCYGFESQRFGIAFTHSLSAPNGIPYFPVQLLEAACEAIIFLFVLRLSLRAAGQGRALWLYLCLYAPARFLLNFFAQIQYAAFGSACPPHSGSLLCYWLLPQKRCFSRPNTQSKKQDKTHFSRQAQRHLSRFSHLFC